jgi:hypothetical protein
MPFSPSWRWRRSLYAWNANGTCRRDKRPPSNTVQMRKGRACGQDRVSGDECCLLPFGLQLCLVQDMLRRLFLPAPHTRAMVPQSSIISCYKEDGGIAQVRVLGFDLMD